MQPSAGPGWYQTDSQIERWWDGTAWGQQVRPVAQPPQRAPRKAVTYSPKRTSHTFHLIMTLLTAGLWGLFVWLPITVINSMRRERSVTRYR
jgi:hypothetical protein